LTKARAKAEEIAREGSFGLGRLISVQINDGTQTPTYYGLGGGMASSKTETAPSPVVQPGSQDVNVTVSLTYEIK
jgi:uncharacterized protein YggE